MTATPPSGKFDFKPYDDEGVLRIRATCSRCGAWLVGNADDITDWQADHDCVQLQKAS